MTERNENHRMLIFVLVVIGIWFMGMIWLAVQWTASHPG